MVTALRASRPQHPWDLPTPRTRLIGRDDEVARLADLVTGTRGSIVTVVGAAGCGKTRLALEVASRLAPSFDDGAAFVSLADLDDPRLVATEIARALDLVDLPAAEPTERLVAGLRSLQVLVVLDSFEHVDEEAPTITAVSAQCDGVAFLVTSRRRLNVTGERTLLLSPLPLPADLDPERTAGAADPDAVPSVALFCERASAVSSLFRAAGADLRAVGEICRLVDGLPLAIELAASHLTVFSPAALLERLERPNDGFTALGRGPLDAAARHRSLKDTIRWSYDLLGETAARLLPRLAIFRGGWTLEAMEATCCMDLTPGEAFDALVELVDLHLVEPVEVTDGQPRFRLLETVRRFAAQALANTEDSTTIGQHADYVVAFATHAGEAMEGRGERRWAGEIRRELPNIRAALQHLSAVDRVGEGLTVATALGPYWLDWGPLREGREWLDRFLASPGGSPRLRAVADGWRVRLAIEQGETSVDGRDPSERLVQARQVLDGTGDLPGWLRLTDHLTNALRLQGRFDLAEEYLVEAIERCRSRETAWVEAELLLRRAVVARDCGDPDRVRDLVAQTTQVARLAEHERVYARAMMNLALSDPTMKNARSELDHAFQLTRDVGDRRGAAMSAAVAAVLALDDGDRAGASRWFLACLDLGVAVGYWHAVAWGVMGVAGLAVRTEHMVEAARLHGAVRPHLDVIRQQTPPVRLAAYDRVVNALRNGLGDDFETECDRGEEQGWPAAVDVARRIATELSQGAERSDPDRRSGRRRGRRANPELTDREVGVLRELVAGHSNQRIAGELGISPKTVMHHTVSVYRKLAVRGRAEAVAHALREGLVAG